MGKPYINNAVIGNGGILGCITETGELIRLYWPEIDFPQHLEKMLTGFLDMRHPNSTLWFSEGEHEVYQRYLEAENTLETTAVFSKLPLKVVQTDFCLPDEPVILRHYTICNQGGSDFHLGMGLASHVTSHTLDMGGTMFDFPLDALVHYRHCCYWAISSDLQVKEFQIGNNPFGAVWEGRLNGIDSIGMSPDGALLWDLGILAPGSEQNITVYITFSENLNDLKDEIRRMKSVSFHEALSLSKQFWGNYLKGCKPAPQINTAIDRLYQRSLLLFGLMSDKKTGGLLASPEIDEGFTQCGRYAYCWGRDSAFITQALDAVGLVRDSERFYDWAVRVQDPEGFWHQRYHMNGNLAPSWGIQIDETGSILFGMYKHFQAVKEIGFLERMWPSVVKAADFLEGFIDKDTGLPLPSFDLWEERMGEHTYSTAAVIAGLRAAAETGVILGASPETTERWRKTAQNIQEALEKVLVDRKNNVFLRSVRTKLNPWGKEPTDNIAVIRVNPKGFSREVTLEDPRMDISLLGPVVPFGVFSHDHPVARNTAHQIEKLLYCERAGGIMRYTDDNYAGGNPWVIASLWLALYYLEAGDIVRARKYFHWSAQCSTHLGFLPEQADKVDGKPCWVIPLTWSHAMYVLVLQGLMDNGGVGEIEDS